MDLEPEQFLALVKERRSIRSFKPDPVDDRDINMILEAMRWSQSASNKQPWRFIVVKDKDIISRLAGCAKYGAFVAQAPVVIAIVADKERAPKWYLHDTCIASENACLMIAALGLGTCWIGSMDREKAAEILGLARNEFLTTILPVGHPASKPRPTIRRKLDTMVTWIG